LILITIDVARIGAISQIRLASKSYTLPAGGHGLRSYPCIGPTVQQTIEYLQAHVAPHETVLVLPEGVTLNFLAGRRSPTPYFNFMPPELVMFGEANIVESLRGSPPDVVVFVRRVLYEYGLERFGDQGFGAQLLAWAHANYEVQHVFGADPLADGDFGIAVLRRRHAENGENREAGRRLTLGNGGPIK
jgi:hypothetical protein